MMPVNQSDVPAAPSSHPQPEPIVAEGSGLAQNAALLSIGNVASRALGLAREMVIARFFPLAQVSAFTVASQVPTLLYDFLIGGMLSAALVPILSDYSARGRKEFAELVSVLLTVFAFLLALITLVLFLFAPNVTALFMSPEDTDPAILQLATNLLRLVAPGIWLFCMAGALTATLFALQRFTWPALATALYNLGIVAAAPLLAPHIGIQSLALGILAGALTQFVLLSWDLWRVQLPLRFHWNPRHPALGRILYLYLPIALGIGVSLFQVGLDRRLANSDATVTIAWMRNATTLQQLPLGLISVAISLAALPRLSQFYANGQEDAYRQTLGRGLRMVMLLVLPAAVILWTLGESITILIFAGDQIGPADIAQITQALHIYTIGMLFAAIDFPLNYAFYARHNTWLPALVGIASVGVWLVVAFTLLAPLGYLGLVWADTAKHGSHVVIMLGFLYLRVGRMGAGVGRGLGLMSIAAFLMGILISVGQLLMPDQQSLVISSQWLASATTVTTLSGIGLCGYLGILRWLRLPEVLQLEAMVWQRIGRQRPQIIDDDQMG